MRVHRRGIAVAVPALAVALVASGCGSGSGNSSKKSSGNTQDTSGVKALDINKQPRDNVKDGGQIIWSMDQFSTQWNYNELDGPEGSTADVMYALMPRLMLSDEHANLRVNKDYADSIELTSKSPQTVTYKLNPKAKWSDGTPITEKDLEAQWKALNGTNTAFQVASTTGYDQIESVKQGADDHEAVVTFKTPYADWQGLFSPLYPAKYNSDPKLFNTGYLNKIPVTAGPFKFGAFDQTAKTVTIEKDPAWWGNPAKLDKIIYKALESTASIQAYVNGEIDVLRWVTTNATNYKQVAAATGGVTRLAAGPNFRHFTFNGTSPIFSDINVRKAVAMGINRETVVKADLNGIPWPAKTMDNHYFVNSQAGYQDNTGEIKYNPDKAKSMLDAAGWKEASAGGFRQKDGKTLTVRFVIPSGVLTSKNEAELTQSMLKEIGVKVDIQAVPSDDFFTKYVNTGNFDITPFSWLGTPYISSSLSIYANPKGDNIQQNYARVGSQQIDDLQKQASQELDVTKSRDLYNQADKLVWDEVHSLTMFQRPEIDGTKNGLANVGAFGFSDIVFEDIGYQK